MIENSKDVNKKVSRVLHWFFAGFVLVMLSLGFTMTSSDYSPAMYFWHKSLGVIFFATIGIRLYWSIRRPWPSSPQGTWFEWLARSVHKLLFILLMAMPLTGFLSSAFSGYSVHLFGLVIVPQNINNLGETEAFNDAVYETAKWLHRVMAYIFSVFISLHILAVLKHHFIDRDGALRKMLGT